LLDETKIKEEHKKDDKNSKISQVIINKRKAFFLSNFLTTMRERNSIPGKRKI